MDHLDGGTSRRGRPGWWPWILLAMLTLPAIWHVLDFPDDIDPEFPRVIRPTFSPLPPPAYRLAEPGDTLDRVGLYLASAAIVLAAWGLVAAWRSGRTSGAWVAGLGLSIWCAWYAATPGPTFDGWHGLGLRTIADPGAPTMLRVGLGAAWLGLFGWAGGALFRDRRRLAGLWARGREIGTIGLLAVALVLIGLRQVEIPGFEPVGYWSRWAFAWGMFALILAFFRARPDLPTRRAVGLAALAGGTAWVALVAGGLTLTWYHRPLERLKEIVPGRIYMCAMPTYRGLEIAHARHGFRTIINLFPEDTPLRSPDHPDELRFAREHGIRYVGSPTGASAADDFLDQTLALARDPDAWPILVHCHGCMDRTPAWVGIYRFLNEGVPLVEVMREIEQHRGYRPKASVTLLYNRVLPPRAPRRHACDPTAALLAECAAGTPDPYYDQLRRETARANPLETPRVSRRDGSTRRP